MFIDHSPCARCWNVSSKQDRHSSCLLGICIHTHTCPQGLTWVCTGTLQNGPAHRFIQGLHLQVVSFSHKLFSEFYSSASRCHDHCRPSPSNTETDNGAQLIQHHPGGLCLQGTTDLCWLETPQFSSQNELGQTSWFPQVTSGIWDTRGSEKGRARASWFSCQDFPTCEWVTCT